MSRLKNPNSATSNTVLRTDALTIFNAGVKAADPYQALKRCLHFDNHQIEILLDPNDNNRKRVGEWSKVHLIAFGKAAGAMAKAAQDIVPGVMLSGPGLAVTNYENVITLDNIELIGASHPLPDEAGLKAAQKIAARINSAQRNELVLVLISGGASALIPCPVDNITLKEKITTTELLLASGATISQINCVRKHLSQLKGGGMARMAIPADLHAFILSDVIGDDLSAIASGPTVPDNTCYADAIEVFKSKSIWDSVPANIRRQLEEGALGKVPETPKADDPAFNNCSHTLIGGNAISVKAMLKTSAGLGYEALLYDDKLCGEAREEAEKWVIHARQLIEKGINHPVALVAGGETTVTLKGKGRGGRNQEMALAFAVAAEQHGLNGSWTFLSGGTDGLDGPTDAAGGIVDQNTIKRLNESAIMPLEMLNNNDSYRALKSSQDLLITGATGTNVADLQVLLIHPSYSTKS